MKILLHCINPRQKWSADLKSQSRCTIHVNQPNNAEGSAQALKEAVTAFTCQNKHGDR